MNTSLPNSSAELKQYLRYLDQHLIEKLKEKLKECYRTILEFVDQVIAECRSKDLQIEQCREVWYQTCLGSVKIKRREYRDSNGQRFCPLDELMGMGKYQHKTLYLQEMALNLASQMPYRRSAEVLQKTTAIDLPHQTIWRLVKKVADSWLSKEEQELNWFKQTGELPESEDKKVPCLMTELDGVFLSLQGEDERKTEVKLGIAYEGWEKIGKDRYKTINKTIYSVVGNHEKLLDGLSLKLHRTYDLAGIPNMVVGGDGAGWIKSGADYLKGQFQLDRYHLHKELCYVYGKDHQIKGQIWQACECGDVNLALALIAKTRQNARGDKLERIDRFYRYLRENASGLGDYRLKLGEAGHKLRHTGAMEGNVDKLIVRRMKNQGMSWSLQGIQRLLCIRFLVYEKKLGDWLERKHHTEDLINIPKRKARKIVTKLSRQEPDQWIKAELPALHGPHANRPWVLALKSLARNNAF